MAKMFELVEIDPATGEVDQLVMTGTFATCSRELHSEIADIDAEWGELDIERHGITWPVLMVQPAP